MVGINPPLLHPAPVEPRWPGPAPPRAGYAACLEALPRQPRFGDEGGFGDHRAHPPPPLWFPLPGSRDPVTNPEVLG